MVQTPSRRLLAETSSQALKPLVIAVAFGLATSTLLVLILLPALHAVFNDMRRPCVSDSVVRN